MRATNTAIHPIMTRMNYTHSSIADEWQKNFSRKPSKAKKTAKKLKAKPAGKAPVKKIGERPETTALVLIKKEPVTFQLYRGENPADFDSMAFVIKAVLKESKYEYLTVLHVEETRTGSLLAATDGRRLHVAEISAKIKSGDYKPVLTKDCIRLGKPVTSVSFPNWKGFVPEKTRKCGMINLMDTGMGKDREQTERLSVVFNSFVKQTGELINLRYLEDLTKTTWSVHCQNENHKAIVLKQEGAWSDTFAVIMPLQEAATEAVAA
jgi:hypothetical protein